MVVETENIEQDETGRNDGENELTARQLRIIPYLVSCRTLDDACKKAGINRKAVWEWMKLESFRRAVDDERNVILRDAQRELKDHILKAVNTLVELLDSKNAYIRRHAANDVIDHVLKLKEFDDFGGRLESLERIIIEKRLYK